MQTVEKTCEEDTVIIENGQLWFNGYPLCMICSNLLDGEPEEPIESAVGFVCGDCVHDYMYKCSKCGRIFPIPSSGLEEDSEEEYLCSECKSKQ